MGVNLAKNQPVSKQQIVGRKHIVLASSSPRRLELMNSLGSLSFTQLPSTGDEVNEGGGRTDIVCGSDSVEILGKPKDGEDAVRMLQKLSGSTHMVGTGYCIGSLRFFPRARFDCQPLLLRACISRVTFRELSMREITEYVASGSPLDKAGAYGIQEEGGDFVDSLDGSISNVMGLPIAELGLDLVRFGIATFAAEN